jgi:hypothetical protein
MNITPLEKGEKNEKVVSLFIAYRQCWRDTLIGVIKRGMIVLSIFRVSPKIFYHPPNGEKNKKVNSQVFYRQ